MSVYGIVIGFLLLFPWSLLGIIVGGAALTALKRKLGGLAGSRVSALSRSFFDAASLDQRSH